MSPFTLTTKFTLAVALLIPCMIALWMMTVPELVSTSTYAVSAALVLALAGVTLITYRNGSAPDSMGQLLHATETAQPAAARTVAAPASASRSEV